MELPPAFPLRHADDTRGFLDSAALPETRSSDSKRFDDILGQTLAGPLFATWTPLVPASTIATPASTASTAVSSLDPNARRDGRKRSRR